ncbi:hypothetical protein GGR50DRAFT_580759 [Xylaria sp. CBS 124048]|nr:hypothetical protein GGR50DRAFT_580759 [Xylaria sp. CBS 124048]
MPDHLGPSTTACEDGSVDSDPDNLRLLSRSPHPYHRQISGILEPSTIDRPIRRSPPPTDSGTEADDEHFLKGLPAPRRLHKGIRGQPENSSGASTPFLAYPATRDETDQRLSYSVRKDIWNHPSTADRAGTHKWRSKSAREIIRRLTELFIVCALGLSVCANVQVRPILYMSSRELRTAIGAVVALILLYPFRLIVWAYRHGKPSRKLPITIPSSFDPAPLLYPPAITLIVSFLIAVDNPAVLIPNIILALCALPRPLIPALSSASDDFDSLHWVLSCGPLIIPQIFGHVAIVPGNSGQADAPLTMISPETATVLYPIHWSLLRILHTLTTTSLLTAELQLLSISLINILLLSSSPQTTIMKAMLWAGGLDILVCCSKPIQWGIALARVPKWRFKRSSDSTRSSSCFLSTLISWRRRRHDLFRGSWDGPAYSSCEAVDESEDTDDPSPRIAKTLAWGGSSTNPNVTQSAQNNETGATFGVSIINENKTETGRPRTHGLSSTRRHRKPQTCTPSGRKKRSASISTKALISLTYNQAVSRKWIYALYVYGCIIGAIFAPFPIVGVKEVVMNESLGGDEPVGWALGYLFGDIQWFRWQVVSRNLQRWIILPPRTSRGMVQNVEQGRVERLQSSFGEANTRLLLAAYCLTTIAGGLFIVFRLSPICEVDTRRKVFHFMMVIMFFPATYVDPCFVALAFAIALAVFLLLDLLRASQLPPLSKPLAFFLAPYVDGRDLRGPVVISHIFLLIGCAIPLWLSLGSLPRIDYGHLQGWHVPVREVAMVSGVICVGLGDAAASLIGRRYGHRKWLWGGGKSLEGSAAFAIAVFLGLMAAQVWLRLGGWATPNRYADSWQTTMQKTGTCAGMASLTEAVLTGGNDNVIVPVVLWACVKGLGV